MATRRPSPSRRSSEPALAPLPAVPVAPTPASTATFAELGVPSTLVEALAAAGIDIPFPIQAATLPDSLAGRDVLGKGRTGSGKTLAFVLPVLTRLARSGSRSHPGRPRALVLAPTRELAAQIDDIAAPLARRLGLRTCTIFGGVGPGPQIKALRAGVDLVIACPGRLGDHIGEGHANLGSVEITVLDEADHMADLGFLPAVRRLLDATPKKGQRLLFSATLDGGVDTIVQRYLVNPVVHSVDPVLSSIDTMTHHVLAVAVGDKLAVVTALASGLDRSLLFMRTKHGAKKLAKQLCAAGIPAVELHGNLSQAARERNLAAFSADPGKGGVRVLVATDVAARGVHVDEVELVVHVDPPMEHKAYLHRSGRTARAGAAGTVVTVTIPSQRRDVADLLRKAGITAPLEQVGAESAPITELVGERAEYVRPAPVQAPQQQRSSKPKSAQTSQGRGGQGNGRGGQGRGGNASGSTGRGASGSAQGRDRNATGSGAARPIYSTGTGQPSHAHNPRPAQAARPTGSRRAQHNGTRSGAPRG